MASIRKRRGKYVVVYYYTNESGEQKQKWESYDKKIIIFNLKRYFLNDKKRNVRYATGIVLNLLTCTEPKISFYNE